MSRLTKKKQTNKQQNAQADLSLRWAHRSLCWLCHEAAHIRVKMVRIIQTYWHILSS